MFWITIIGMVFMPVMLGVLMFIKKYPDLAQNSIMLSKATAIPGNGDWPAYFGIFAQMISGAGLVVFGQPIPKRKVHHARGNRATTAR